MADKVSYKAILTPDEVYELVIKPLEKIAIAAQAAKVDHITAGRLRFPIITSDPSAAWVPEGGKIPVSDGAAAEVVADPAKLAVLTNISNELRDDSSPAATDAIGNSLLRDAAKKLDQAWLSAPVINGPQTTLANVTGVNVIPVTGSLTSLDPFVDAASAIEDAGVVTDWVMNKADRNKLAKIRKSTGSNEGLLAADVTQGARYVVEGGRVHVSPYCPEGTVYGLDASQSHTVIRRDASVESSDQWLWDTDQTSLRMIMRAAFAFPNPAAISKITVAA
ncbi:phage major capsid protein [Rhodococcus sp. IEGM 1408]|uniref:phage major capsid protein n=1 Tax=Rhodococcus sp. IEGM 1408 TaxID=3082220 RepID=UPI0029540ACE|nr:phage major capsid protein [Rhodococcus sp. IEGM 1408]MDV8000374.1 phage major capsid protein [Rhodococcus sp. IEGM 1408]